MNDLSWRARRAAARWLFVERRMRYVAEEVRVSDGNTIGLGKYGVEVPSRCADAIGLTFWPASDSQLGPIAGQRVEKPTVVRIIEVKISRADLVAGIKKGQVSNASGGFGDLADYCHLLLARDVRVDFGEIPPGWGVLRYSETSNGAQTVLTERPARRLNPTHPLHARARDLRETMVQASLWRHYSYETTISYRRYRDSASSYERRDISGELEASETPVPSGQEDGGRLGESVAR